MRKAYEISSQCSRYPVSPVCLALWHEFGKLFPILVSSFASLSNVSRNEDSLARFGRSSRESSLLYSSCAYQRPKLAHELRCVFEVKVNRREPHVSHFVQFFESTHYQLADFLG